MLIRLVRRTGQIGRHVCSGYGGRCESVVDSAADRRRPFSGSHAGPTQASDPDSTFGWCAAFSLIRPAILGLYTVAHPSRTGSQNVSELYVFFEQSNIL